jgi:hypothetical protein
MARREEKKHRKAVKKITSIGSSSKTRPKNKNKRKNTKKYRGQGRS